MPGPPQPPFASDDSAVTLGEVYRTLDRFRTETDRRFSELDKKVVGIDFYNVSHAALEGRVKTLEEDAIRAQTWHRSIVLGLVVSTLAAVGALVSSLVVNLH